MDSLDMHREFRKRNNLPFELLSDENGRVTKLYDAKVPWVKVTKRLTYLLDDQHKIVGVYQNFLDGPRHIKEMMSKIKSSGSFQS